MLNSRGDVIESMRDDGGRVVGEVFSETWHLNLRVEKEAAMQKPEMIHLG